MIVGLTRHRETLQSRPNQSVVHVEGFIESQVHDQSRKAKFTCSRTPRSSLWSRVLGLYACNPESLDIAYRRVDRERYSLPFRGDTVLAAVVLGLPYAATGFSTGSSVFDPNGVFVGRASLLGPIVLRAAGE